MHESMQEERVYPHFYKKAIQHKGRTRDEGRPVFVDVDYIRIDNFNDKYSIVDRKVTDQDKVRFAKFWEAYQAGDNIQIEGTPVDQWPVLTPAQVQTLKAQKLFTVEQVSDVSDAALTRLGAGWRDIRDRAKNFIEVQAPNAANAEKISKLESDLATAVEQIAEFKATIEAQHKMIESMGERKSNKGRKRKVSDGNDITDMSGHS